MRTIAAGFASLLALCGCANAIPTSGPVQPMEFSIRGSLNERCYVIVVQPETPCLLFIYHNEPGDVEVVQLVRSFDRRNVVVSRTVYQIEPDVTRQRLPADGGLLATIRMDGLRGFIYTAPGGERMLMKLSDIRGCWQGDARRVEDDEVVLDAFCKLRMQAPQERQLPDRIEAERG
jgi:hypothetical protein